MDTILLEKFIKAIKKYNMIQRGDKVLVGFSGGPDSVFLVEVFRSLKDYLGISFSCLHVNHMLRGQESERDEAFCKSFCKERGIELYVVRVNVNNLKKDGESIEEAARRLRYDKYSEYSERYGFDKIALAHTASDSVETFLINLLRGTGVIGLKGIPPIRGKIIRPLIYITRKEIADYLDSKRVPYVVDSSNLLTKFLRNRIRLELIPYLENIRPGAFDKIRETSEIMVDLVGFLENELEKIGNETFKNTFSWAILIDCSRFKNYHYFLQKLFFQRRLNLTYQEMENLEGIISHKKFGKVKGFQIFCSFKEIFVAPENKRFPEIQISLKDLPVKLPDFNMVIERSHDFSTDSFVMGFKKEDFPIKVRAWKSGDFYRGKKLSDLFNSRKVSAWRRHYYPIFESNGKILWVPGLLKESTFGEIFLEVRKIDEGKYWIFDN